MRAAAILGLGCTDKNLRPFQLDGKIEWGMGMPADAGEADAVLIFGGDGTVHRHLNELVKLGLPVLLVPAGSGNDFARALGFSGPKDSLAAWRRFCTGEKNVRAIDLGVVTSLVEKAGGAAAVQDSWRYFGSVAGIGLDCEVARRANELPRWLRGHGGYALSLGPAIFRFAPVGVRVLIPAENGGWVGRSDQPTLLAAFANTSTYGGGMKIAPQARVDDGLLEVCLVGAINPFKLFCLFPSVYVGKHLGIRGVEYFEGPQARVETEFPLDVYADGEFVCKTPVEIGVKRAALRIIS